MYYMIFVITRYWDIYCNPSKEVDPYVNSITCIPSVDDVVCY